MLAYGNNIQLELGKRNVSALIFESQSLKFLCLATSKLLRICLPCKNVGPSGKPPEDVLNRGHVVGSSRGLSEIPGLRG